VSLSLANGLAQGLAGSPIGPLVDMGQRATLLAEAVARRRLWLDLQAALWEGPSGHPAAPAGTGPRPTRVPPGPVEQYADRALLASLGATALTAATTRSFQRSSAMLQAGLPKAARYGREAFAAHLGRVLTTRGILPLDSRSLRLLDRVDCLVLDVDLLVRHEFELTAVTIVEPASDGDPERLARRLFDRRRPEARRRRGPWTLAPLEVLGLDAPPGKKRLASRMAKRGVALGSPTKAGSCRPAAPGHRHPREGLPAGAAGRAVHRGPQRRAGGSATHAGPGAKRRSVRPPPTPWEHLPKVPKVAP
jgi:cation-transporting ATPase I